MLSITLLRSAALFITLLACSLGAFAQKISIGVVGGASATDAFQDQVFPAPPGFLSSRFYSPSKDYIVGGSLELGFSRHWSVEADGLFRQLHMNSSAVMPDGSLNSVSPSPVVTWEFPVLTKYRFHWAKVSPFFEGGPSFRTAGNLNGTTPSHVGITTGFGLELYWKSLKIAPVARYTRWVADNNSPNSATTAQNQLEILVGLSAEGDSNWRPLGRHVSLGLAIGTNLTGDYRTSTWQILGPDGQPTVVYLHSSGPPTFIVGPLLEFRLSRRFSLEVDALYRPISDDWQLIYQKATGSALGLITPGAYHDFTWTFPILAKYTLPIHRIHPFVELGPSFRYTSVTSASPYGVTAGAGMDIQLRHIKVTPALRFTCWAAGTISDDSLVRNEMSLLLSFSF